MALLEVHNLHVSYGAIHAVKGVSLRVEEGEIVSLIGANGAGKTTTLQTISGLLPAKEGEVLFAGKSLRKKRAHEILKAGIAQVPEGRRIFRALSVEDNLKLGAYASKESLGEQQERLARILKVFPILRERREQEAGTLSGGEQQMLAIGRAMMSHPRLIILDEPSMGLSPLFVKEVFRVIRHLHEEGVSLLVVEQNARMAMQVSDRVYVLETGTIVAEGTAAEMEADESVRRAYLGA
uniref:ABC transporter ATP-binding protein n=1 Tax=Ndongobacter massiliensis TaxID=1871025 RepID=UPI000930BF29|nr:ABC transporter ATP-binding protein [Ndongobacter massiliensis]